MSVVEAEVKPMSWVDPEETVKSAVDVEAVLSRVELGTNVM